MGWTAVILGDALPRTCFHNEKTNNRQWERILNALSLYSENLIATVIQELVVQLGHQAPISLLKGSHDQAFLAWFDGTLEDQTDFGRHGGLKSVSWIAGRIAQLWHYRANVLPTEKYCFTQLLETQGMNVERNSLGAE